MREKRGPSHPHIRNCCCQLFVFEVYTKELLGKRHLWENGKKKRDYRKGRSREPLYDELKCTPWEEKKPERDGLPRGPSAFLLKAKVIVYLPERIWFVYRTINRILYYHSSKFCMQRYYNGKTNQKNIFETIYMQREFFEHSCSAHLWMWIFATAKRLYFAFCSIKAHFNGIASSMKYTRTTWIKDMQICPH